MSRYSKPMALVLGMATLAAATPSHAEEPTYRERFRPQFHYTPAQNWMNDPNGLVYYQGEYHLFYQFNPFGNTWGNMSWGHAVSPDLLHWDELPVALLSDPEDPGADQEQYFSGGAVIDWNNSSGFGTLENPPMVAIYTSWFPNGKPAGAPCDEAHARAGLCLPPGSQVQSIAYSLDSGRSWTPYAQNPVINGWTHPSDVPNPREFRDPKVVWHEESQQWVMATVLATDHRVRFYGSANLKDWHFLSDFGPANATGGIWEVPDLFELPVDGDTDDTRWVLVVNLNPGAIAGGSGAQYFIGDFDGVEFRAENVYDDLPPAGVPFETFDGPGTYAERGWDATEDFFGLAPVDGTFPGQQEVSGYRGDGLANTFTAGDAPTGSLTSPPFTIDGFSHINLLVGGGRHPHDPAAGDGTVPDGELLFPGADFEGPDGITYAELGWTPSGVFVGEGPVRGGPWDPGYLGERHVQSYIGSDAAVGTLVSPLFQIGRDYINFVIGSGDHPYPDQATAVVLRVDGQVVRSATGKDDPTMDWVAWDVREFAGSYATIEIIDQNSGGWGHVSADHFFQSDAPALPRPTETTVSLLVDGEVVRTATGENSEQLHWASWNVDAFAGQEARIRILDKNEGSWGHILVDDIRFADEPVKRADWIDYGKDFYAVVSYENMPGGDRIWLGWMNNWNYANDIPTAPWRSAQSIPRDVGLRRTADGKVELVQTPIIEVAQLRRGPVFALDEQLVAEGQRLLNDKGARGKAVEITAEFEPGSATRFGLKLRVGDGEETLVGYDAELAELFVDRNQAQAADVDGFHPDFAGRHVSPLQLEDGILKLHILLDWSSVEVFAGDGSRVITDRIFPSDDSDRIALFAEGGDALLKSLRIQPLASIHKDASD